MAITDPQRLNPNKLCQESKPVKGWGGGYSTTTAFPSRICAQILGTIFFVKSRGKQQVWGGGGGKYIILIIFGMASSKGAAAGNDFTLPLSSHSPRNCHINWTWITEKGLGGKGRGVTESPSNEYPHLSDTIGSTF